MQGCQPAKREKSGWSLACGAEPSKERAAPAAHQKGIIGTRGEGCVGQAGTASNIREDEGASSGVRICILSTGYVQASHLQGTYPCTGEGTPSMGTDTKKDGHTGVERSEER